MPKLPKSVVLEGRRYPTWALSSQARDQLVNLHHVDAHIAEIRERLAYFTAAREILRNDLHRALPNKSAKAHAYRDFWHIVPPEWAKKHLPCSEPILNLRPIGAGSHYRKGDRILLYVKGHGLFGWGVVELDTHSTQRHLALRFEAASLSDALPASVFKDFALRHPNRSSQILPSGADVEGVLKALEARPAAIQDGE